MSELSTGLAIIHANRLETLRDLLVRWMRDNPLPPLVDEQILVQSNGIAQWLRLALAAPVSEGGCGIAAGLQVELPSAFLWRAYRAVLGKEAVPPQSPYDKPQLRWRLLRLLPDLLKTPEFASLAQYLESDPGERKAYQLAEHLADLFDQYQVYRADWLADWAEGLDQLRMPDGGEPRLLDEDQRWQPRLWRAIRADLQAEVDSSRADLHQRFLEACKQLQSRPRSLPPRLMVFGISALPQQMIEALAALSGQIQVMVAVLNPCRFYWADIIEGKELLRAEHKRQQRREGVPVELSSEQMHLHAPPLLAAWGKQGRDYIRLLDEFDQSERYRHWFNDSRIDLFDEPEPDIASLPLLQQLQQDILELNPVEKAPREWFAGDDSLVFHLAHSAQREVEVLQDQILKRLDEDPTLKPRDMIVMVPDIGIYQPHIEAVFGRLPKDDPRFIPYSLADQSSRGQVPLLVALEQLLRLPELRLGASELLDLLEVPALQQRYGLTPADIPTLQRWIDGAGIRWGLDADHRAGLELPQGLEQNAWLFGMRRMLLGYAIGDGEAFADIEPYDEVAGLEAALAGSLALLLDDLRELLHRLTAPQDALGWREQLNWLLDRFFAPQDDADLLLNERLVSELQSWTQGCIDAELTAALPLTLAREAWLGGIDQGSLSARFMAGRLTFSTLMPMRAIPFRQVFLLGMNDGDYPRIKPPQDFDLMAGQYRPGDRSRREDDRYLFLEAMLSAREQLYISWVGRSIRDNQPQPPSVLVAQLRDHLNQGWKDIESEEDVAQQLTLEHPLQPFSTRYFDGSGQADPRLFTYAQEWREIHDSVGGDSEQDLPAGLPEGALTLQRLGRFLRYPVRAFFNERLNVYFQQPAVQQAEHEPFAFDNLEQFQLGQELIDLAHGSAEPSRIVEEELERWRRAGRLPLGEYGPLALQPILSPVRSTLRHLEPLAEWQPMEGALEIDLKMQLNGSEIPIEDWLSGVSVRDGAYALIRTSPQAVASKNGPRWHRLLRLWVEHLCGCAQGYDLRSWLVGPDTSVLIEPLAPKSAQEILEQMVSCWAQAMQAPPPLACKTGLALLTEPPEKAIGAAARAYLGTGQFAGEVQQDPALARAWPEFEQLADPGLEEGLEAWARALYEPLLQHAHAQGTGERE
ncbi:exodeoxyribonuclease V subunit gamma [Marinobacterium mangrovicola]|uniref:RecBCD enzyme subunit RecC n=1 Tax=Marinobacterium mangrovicola TaxID=1476959 RepID=A0A4R1GG76_9GAMM|nr:exodeoxyribonuclease V subunit gamma [Marinobacterium mangrovicola]TCK05900.1 DNA helicase/exodeoxyribonuclease V gamma subunit [Marinobacterium mangrovicola]